MSKLVLVAHVDFIIILGSIFVLFVNTNLTAESDTSSIYKKSKFKDNKPWTGNNLINLNATSHIDCSTIKICLNQSGKC